MKYYYLWRAKNILEYFVIVSLLAVYAVWKNIYFLDLWIAVYWIGTAGFMIYCFWRHRSFLKRLKTAKQTFVRVAPTKVHVCLETYNSKWDRARISFECEFEENSGQIFHCHSESYIITYARANTNWVNYDRIELKQMPEIWIYPEKETGKYLVDVQLT